MDPGFFGLILFQGRKQEKEKPKDYRDKEATCPYKIETIELPDGTVVRESYSGPA